VLTIAATVYFFQLGRAGCDDAEAYSAYIASRATMRGVFAASLNLDPGKGGGLYVLTLHWYCGLFGTGEVALRAFSAAFALASVTLVYALAAELFGPETALIAATLWAFNPMASIVARWARMYSMFIALTFGNLLAMRKVQRRPTVIGIATFGILGAAMLYTHLASALILGAEVALLARDRWRGRPIFAASVGVAIAVILFAPIAPISLAQVHSSALGHRFDWIGSATQTPLAIQIAGSLVVAAMGLMLLFGPSMPFDHADGNPRDSSEPMRWCATWTILPMLALAMGSLLLHPMFLIRYIAPVTAGFAILGAAALNHATTRLRNLATAAIASAFLIVTILFHLYHSPFELWGHIAREVATKEPPSQEVFFESGYVMGISQAAGLDPDSLIEVLPNGYLRIPFDYYFDGQNPRRAINPFRPALARDAIAQSAREHGGAWLVSHLDDADLGAELPCENASKASVSSMTNRFQCRSSTSLDRISIPNFLLAKLTFAA
jgi:4-amino-4-deoxy-L-arabinose transferase-like glycosyltransferase